MNHNDDADDDKSQVVSIRKQNKGVYYKSESVVLGWARVEGWSFA